VFPCACTKKNPAMSYGNVNDRALRIGKLDAATDSFERCFQDADAAIGHVGIGKGAEMSRDTG